MHNEKLSEAPDSEQLRLKIERLQLVNQYMENFDGFLTEKTWNKRFEVHLGIFYEICMDPNLKVFLGLQPRADNDESDIEMNKVQPIDQGISEAVPEAAADAAPEQ